MARSRAGTPRAVGEGRGWESARWVRSLGRREEKKARGALFGTKTGGKKKRRCELNDSIAKPRGCRHASSTLFQGVCMWHTGTGCCLSVALLLTQALWCYSWPASSLSWSPLSASPSYVSSTCARWHSLGCWGIPGWSGGTVSLPRLCTPAGPLAERKLLEGHVSCHISSPVSPVSPVHA